METIVFLVEQVINKGPQNVVLDICRCIDRDNFRPIIFSLRGEDLEKSIESEFIELGIEIFHFNVSHLQQELQTCKVASRVRKKFQEVGGDILHAHCYHPQLIASQIRDVKTVATIHNISGENFIMKKGHLLGGYMKWRFGRTFSKIDCSVAISDYMMKYYSDKCRNLTKIANGVSYRKDSLFDAEGFKRNVGIDGNSPVVVVTGTVSARKNVVYLVSELKNSNKSFVCIIIGSGDKLEECKQITNTDERFRYEGYRSNVSDYLNIADFYISASKSEGLPLSVLEAINMGVPCLLSNILPHEEIVHNMNVAGVSCFESKNGALLEAFERMLDANYSHGDIEAKACQVYSADVMARGYEKVYNDLIKS